MSRAEQNNVVRLFKESGFGVSYQPFMRWSTWGGHGITLICLSLSEESRSELIL